MPLNDKEEINVSDVEMGILELIDRLQMLVNDSRPIPFSNKLMIDRDVISDLVNKLGESVPTDVKTAAQILDKENEIISASQKQANEMTRNAEQTAKNTIDSANRQAQATTNDAVSKAAETVRLANEQAAAILSDAQSQHNAMLQDAQNRAHQMVSEHEILTRAQAEAQELRDTTQHECDAYSHRVHEALDILLEQTDNALARQLDGLRVLRQQINTEG